MPVCRSGNVPRCRCVMHRHFLPVFFPIPAQTLPTRNKRAAIPPYWGHSLQAHLLASPLSALHSPPLVSAWAHTAFFPLAFCPAGPPAGVRLRVGGGGGGHVPHLAPHRGGGARAGLRGDGVCQHAAGGQGAVGPVRRVRAGLRNGVQRCMRSTHRTAVLTVA